MKQQNLLINTITLTISSLLVRILGMISMIFLSQILGYEGIGIYQLSMSIYMTAVIFSSAGISTTISKVIAEQLSNPSISSKEGNIKKIMLTAILLSLFISLFIALCLFTFAPFITHYIVHTNYTTSALRFLSLSLPFIACSSCFKGYFYASQKSLYPATADVLEQLVKLGLIIMLVKHYSHLGLSYTYLAIARGLTFGEIASWSYLILLFVVENRKKQGYSKPASLSFFMILKKIMPILLPIALISYSSYIFVSLEDLLIPIGLKKFGESFSSSMSLYGMIKGMVIPILFFPSAFLTAFSTTLIPEITKFHLLKQDHHVRLTALRVLQFTFILSIIVVSIFISYGNELGFILYKSDTVGPMLRTLAIIVPFSYIEVMCDGILKGLDEQLSCLKYTLLDSICRILLVYLVVPFKGIYALLGIIIMSSLFTSTLNFNKLLSLINVKFHLIDWLIKPGIAAAFASTYSRLIINFFFRYRLGLTTKTLLGIFLIFLMYIPLLFAIKTISAQDITWLKKHLSLFIVKKGSTTI